MPYPRPRPLRKRIALLAAFAGMAASAAALAGESASRDVSYDDRTICAAATAAAERATPIPAQLLHAISLVESGRQDDATQESFAWPWTIMAEGKGRYLPSKDAAIREVEALQARGVTNIDVGCMQVNLHFHGDAFQSLEEAFDPISNVAYAAQFLMMLREEYRSWTVAVKHYHSATRHLNQPYRDKVYKAWRTARRQAASAARLAAAERSGARDTRFLAQWPPTDVQAQRRAEAMARARVMSPRRF